ncbi:MAG TPA: hypothetical protein VMG34_16290 [Bacteroidota bacterium]|nr:hypothetical protein [Bacteroidota bacterium]
MTVLFFVAMIITFLAADYFVERRKKPALVASPVRNLNDPLRLPSGVFFSPTHTWLTLFPSGKVRIGVDNFVLRMMKSPQLILLKSPGTAVKKGEPLLQLKDGSRTMTACSPIDGEVLELNERPEVSHEGLFSGGWAYTMRPKRSSDITAMLLGEQSQAWIREEFGRLRDFVAGFSSPGELAPALMQDGGISAEGILGSFSDAQVKQFEQQFLRVE